MFLSCNNNNNNRNFVGEVANFLQRSKECGPGLGFSLIDSGAEEAK